MLDSTRQAKNSAFVYDALDRLRGRLLDLSKRNRLLNFRDSKKSISVVDELPDQVYRRLFIDCAEMQFIPLPEVDEADTSERQSQLFERDDTEVLVEEGGSSSAGNGGLKTDFFASLPATNLSEQKTLFIQQRVRALLDEGGNNKVPATYSSNSTVDTYARAFAQAILNAESLKEEVVEEPKYEVVDTNLDLPEIYDGEIKEKHDDDFLQTRWESSVLERRCKSIAQDAKSAIEETGSNLLYLAIGFLEWKESADSTVSHRAPLILIPVTLERKKLDAESQCYRYSVTYTEEDIKTNLSLAHKLENDFGISLPEFISNGSDEEGAVCLPEKYLAKVTQVISAYPGWKVKRHMVLGFFSFSKILIYNDLDPEVWSNQGMPIIDHPTLPGILAGIGQSPQEDEEEQALPFGEDYHIDEIEDPVPIVLDADSSQHSAIIDVVNREKNLVIEGPPGTGKSQTIANIISAALNAGKSVLFLSEKKAALDVVKRRLDTVGLGDFCFELHSHKSRKATAYEDLKLRLESVYSERQGLSSKASQREVERAPLSSYATMISKKIGSTELTPHEIFMAAQRWRAECESDFEGCEINSFDPLHTVSPDLMRRHEVFLSDLGSCIAEVPSELRALWVDFFSWLNIDYKKIVPGDEEWVASGLAQICDKSDIVANAIAVEYPNILSPSSLGTDYRGVLDIDVSLAKKSLASPLSDLFENLIYSQNRKTLEDFLESISTVGKVADKISKYIKLEGINFDDLESAKQKAVKLGAYGYNSTSIAGSKAVCASVRKVVATLGQLAEFKTKYMPEQSGTIQAIKKFVEISSLIANAPDSLCGAEASSLVGEKPRSLYKSLRPKCEAVVSEKLVFADKYNLRLLPQPDEIVSLARQLKIGQGRVLSFLSGPFRKAKQDLSAFASGSVNPKDPATVDELLGLADLLKKEVIVEKEIFQAGNLFGEYLDGFDTDWDTLGRALEWVNTLSKNVGDESCVRSILSEQQVAFASIESASLDAQRLLALLEEGRRSLVVDRIDERVKLQIQKTEFLHIESSLTEFLSASDEVFSNQEILVGQISPLIANAQKFLNAARGLDNDQIRDLLGSEYKGVATDSHILTDLLRCVEKSGLEFCERSDTLGLLLKDEGLSAVVKLVEVLQPSLSRLDGAIQTFSKRLAHRQADNSPSFTEYWDLTILECRDSALPAFEQTRDELSHLAQVSLYFQSIANIYRTKAHGKDVGFFPELYFIIEGLENSAFSRDKALALYRANIYHGCALKIFQEFPDLSLFSRSMHENRIHRFRALDKEIIELQRDSFACNAARRTRHLGTRGGRKSDWTEGALLNHQVNLQRRHLALRQLVKRAGKAVLSFKPCFMMSPLSVAQYLPPGYLNFDLVVMDEASQMRPEDALGGIIRGRQLVVVGDPKQLPPTNFFSSLGNTADADEDDGYAIEDAESILDICRSAFPSRRLRWHYRSEHEKLIQFSNSRFYDDELLVFPSPYHENRNYGVYHHYVDGALYTPRKGENLLEAKTVVEAIVQHLKNHSGLSLGVATFNQAQRDLIRDLLETRAKSDSRIEHLFAAAQLGDEPFFVKNLENVQGDERDVIFISTTFGRITERARPPQRFGPINSDVGWRRLNVIITRAKKRLELFTSLRSGEVVAGESSHKGVVALKDYLAFAETGLLPDRGVISGREPDSDFEIDVARVLSDYGYETKAQVGVAGFFIDLAVVNPYQPGDLLLGIECDGASYHSAKSARDRDRIRQEVLEAKGWKIHRIWSTDWFVNREKEIERLRSVVQALSMEYKEKHGVSDVVETPIEPVRVATIRSMIDEKIVEKPTEEVVVAPDKPTESEDTKLFRELLEYRKQNIEADFGESGDGILREQMLQVFVKNKPISKVEFLSVIPLALRETTSGDQVGLFLGDIFEIIEEYV